VPADSVLKLEALHGGLLRDVSFVLDPAGGGADIVLADGVAAAGAAFAVCRSLCELLVAAGARCTLTRDATESPSDLQRLERTLALEPAWFLGIESGAGPGFVLHDPGSAPGERLAKSLAGWLGRRLGGSFPVRAETRFMLRQTPCPAVIVRLPADALRGLGCERRCAYATFVGMRGGITTGDLPQAVLTAEVAPEVQATLAELDGAAVLPVDRDGRCRFEAVEPGVHRLRILGTWPSQTEVRVDAGADTVHVRVMHPAR
jgi:hypothetical protein